MPNGEPGLSRRAVNPDRGSIVQAESHVRARDAQARRALRRLERHWVGNPIDHGDRRRPEGVGVFAAQPGLPGGLARGRRGEGVGGGAVSGAHPIAG